MLAIQKPKPFAFPPPTYSSTFVPALSQSRKKLLGPDNLLSEPGIYPTVRTGTTTKLLDRHLIEKCRAGDRKAQQAVYERFAGRMFRLCLRYLKQDMEAEDAVVEGFVKVFTKLDTFEFRGEGSLEAWISRIMVNESLMMLRKRKNIVSVDQNEAIQLDSGVSTDSAIRAEDLYELVRQLPDGYRTVFNLYAIEGYPHKEIAEMLGISENTSKTQLFKARAALQGLLEKYGIRQ